MKRNHRNRDTNTDRIVTAGISSWLVRRALGVAFAIASLLAFVMANLSLLLAVITFIVTFIVAFYMTLKIQLCWYNITRTVASKFISKL